MSNLPFRPGPGHLALVRPDEVPPVPPSLRSDVAKWHRGKKFNVIKPAPEADPPLKAGDQILAPWVGIVCTDADLHHDFYSIDDVCTTSDDDDVAQNIWEHCVAWVKGRRDGLTHNLHARCLFSDPRGFAGEDFWTWALGFGPNGAIAQVSPSLGMSAGYRHPGQPAFRTVEDQILAYGAMLQAGFRDLQTYTQQQRAMDQSEIQSLRQSEQATREARDRMVTDQRRYELEAWQAKVKMQLFSKFLERFGGIVGPYFSVNLGRWLKSRFSKAKSKDEETALLVIRGLLEHFRDKGGIKTKEEFEKYLDGMDIKGGLREDVIDLANRFVMDEMEEKEEEKIFEGIADTIMRPKTAEPMPPIVDPVTKQEINPLAGDGDDKKKP